MNTPRNGNGCGNGRSEVASSLIRLPDGRPVPFEFVNSQKGDRNGNMKLPPAAQSLAKESQFERLADGTLVDLVRGRTGEIGFVVYNNGIPTFRTAFKDGSVILVPPKLDRSLADALRLPKALGACETPRALLGEIDDVLCTYLDLSISDRKLVAHFGLYTWLSDLPGAAPYLWIVGPYSCGKSTLLRLLGAICRRSILAGEISPAALHTVSTSLRPTLLLDEFEMGRDARSRGLQRLLRSGSSQGQSVLRCHGAYDLFGPKAIASRQMSGDTALASRALLVTMRPTTRDLAALDPDVLEEIADRLQPKLLAFRLENYARVKAVVLKSSRLASRMRDMTRALALPLLGDPDLERELVELVGPHDAQAKVDRHGEPEWVVMTALFGVIHRATNTLTVQELTFTVEQVLANGGESYKLAPRKVGDILRSLGFSTQKLGNQGRGLRLSKDLIHSIHLTAKNMGVCRADILYPEVSDGGYGGSPCTVCEEVGLMVNHDGKALRCVDVYSRPRGRSALYD
jgi:hypothetical protein